MVIEQKAPHHQPCAENRFNGCRHGKRIARAIHNGDVACAGFIILGLRGQECFPPGRIARAGVLHGAVPIHQLRTRGQIGAIRQPLHRHRHEIRIRKVKIAVGKGQAPGLPKQMRRIQPARVKPRHIEMFKQAKDLRDRDTARRRGREAANPEAAIGCANGAPLPWLVAGEVFQRHDARIGRVVADGGDDVFRNRAPLQRRRAIARNSAERFSQGWVAQPMAGWQRQAIRGEEIGGRGRIAPEQQRIGSDFAVEARADRETFFGEPDGGFHQTRPGQLAMSTMRRFQHGQYTRHANGPPAGHGFQERHGPAIAQE